MLTDFRLALRQLKQSPGFTALAVITLALGLGANTAIFSVVEAALLRPLPFPEPDRVVRLYEAYDDPDTRANTLNLSEITLRDWREHAREAFLNLAAATGASITLGATDSAPARNFPAARITANFLSVLGLSPMLGRNFSAAEDQPGGPHVVIVSHNFWLSELGGRPEAIGQSVLLDNAPYTVVGVMPPHFRHPYRADLWIPLGAAFNPVTNRGHYLYGVARLQPGLTIAQADAALRRVCASINTANPDPANPRRAYIRPLREGFIVDLRPKLLVIAAAAGCALLIAATNFSGLLLARSVGREAEIAVRAALGATRGRLVRETLAQALVLAALGTLAGLLLASWLTPALVALSPEASDTTGSAMREFDYSVHPDFPVFMFAAGLLLVVAFGCGLLPAWRVARTSLRGNLTGAARGATLNRGTQRLLGFLVVAEIAAAAVLLVGSFLLTQHFRQLTSEPWGFATDHRLTFNAMLSNRLFPDPAERFRTAERIASGLQDIPGVRSATAMLPHPMQAARELVSTNIEGVAAPEPRGYYMAYLRSALPGHLATLGQALRRGRDFAATDRADTQLVCLVNETFARRFWPGKDPVGHRIKWGRLDGPRPWFTVIGVVADYKAMADPDDGEVVGTLTFPLPQLMALSSGFEEISFVLETSIDPLSLEIPVRAALAHVDSRLGAYEVNSLDASAAQSRATDRFALVLVSLFGGLGLVLASIGLYGLLALQVARRTREFGIRSALGASAGEIIRLVVGRGFRLLVAGISLGGVAAWIGLRLVRSYWPDLPEAQPVAWLGAATLLAFVAAIACWLPARRAAKVDPMVALRAE